MRNQISVVLYPIFLKCCKYITDPFWIYLYEDMAFGKCPFGIIIQDNCIYCVLKNKEFTYSLHDDPKLLCEELCALLSNKLQLFSQQDHFRFRNECQSLMNNYMSNMSNWNDIRKKNLKDLLLERFSLSQKTKFNYSLPFTKKLFAIIFIGIQFKTIINKHIHCHQRAITQIEGIQCRPDRITCTHNIFIAKTGMPIHLAKNKYTTRISSSWKRYLMSL